MATTKTPAAPTQDNSQPVGTPPGGGSWTWSAEQAAWVPRMPTSPAPATNETPQE